MHPHKIGDIAAAAGIRHVHVVAWRDVDDPEGGGSERHAAELCRRWAHAGLQVSLRTSHAAGQPSEIVRDGYRVTRRAGRYLIFPRAAASAVTGHAGDRDALVEIWNGMPFFSPLWHRGPRLVLLHHVHGAMWDMVLPPRLARVGRALESRIAPPFYRGTQIATLSNSSRETICREMGFDRSRVAVVPPGVDDRFQPTGDKSPTPLVLTVGRLMPAKRVPQLVASLAAVRDRIPELRLVVVGDGYDRHNVQTAVDNAGAESWVEVMGQVGDDDLLELYRRAWVIASASSHEGWGMTLTEAAACGTPAVATDIEGHRDAVVDGVTGVLCPSPEDIGPAVADLIADDTRRRAMEAAALQRAAELSWDTTALDIMKLLAGTHR